MPYKNGHLALKNLRERQQRNKMSVRSIKEENPCYFCGEAERVALDFHHTHSKTMNIGATASHSTERLLEEIYKCIVLCANCHRKVHAGVIALPPDLPHPVIPQSVLDQVVPITNQPKLFPDDLPWIDKLASEGVSYTEIARRYGVSRRTLYDFRHRDLSTGG